jgi:hypothetical protein
MGMTLAVYRIDAKSGKRITVRKRYKVAPENVPVCTSAALPPCACERCRNAGCAGVG